MFDNTNNPATTTSGHCVTVLASETVHLPLIDDPMYYSKAFGLSAALADILTFVGSDWVGARYGLLHRYDRRPLHALLGATGAKAGDVLVYDAPSFLCGDTLSVAFRLESDDRHALVAVTVWREGVHREERAYLLDSTSSLENGETWAPKVKEAATALPVAVFAAPSGLALPDDPGFNPAQPLRDYADFVRTSLDLVTLRLDGLSSGLAHPVRTPDLAHRMLNLLCETDTEVLGAAYGEQPFLLVYRPKSRAGETRLCLEVELEGGDFLVVGLSVETALVDLPESLELLPPEDELVLLEDAA